MIPDAHDMRRSLLAAHNILDGGGRGSLQSRARVAIERIQHEFDMVGYLTDKLHTNHGFSRAGLRDQVEAILLELRRMAPKVAAAWVRSALNGWTTSSRMHDEDCKRWACIAFCDAPDSDNMQHYFCCTRVARMVADERRWRDLTWGSHLLLEPQGIRVVYAVCRAYHKTRHNRREELNLVCSPSLRQRLVRMLVVTF